jgi:hypothetical protein
LTLSLSDTQEAAWAISNATSGGTEEHVNHLIALNVCSRRLLSWLLIVIYRFLIMLVITMFLYPFLFLALFGCSSMVSILMFMLYFNFSFPLSHHSHVRQVLEPMCDLLACPDVSVVIVILEGFENILKIGDTATASAAQGENVYADMLEKQGIIESLEELQNHVVCREKEGFLFVYVVFFIHLFLYYYYY